MDASLAVVCGVGTLLVRVGMGFHQCGMMRAKNSAGSVLRQAADLSVAALAFWLVGSALAFPQQPARFLGFNSALLANIPDLGLAPAIFVLLTLALLASGIINGAAGERSRFYPMLALSVVVAGVVVPVCAMWAWGPNSWLQQLGYRDYGGASIVHVVGGLAAALAVLGVGPRNGKYNRDGSSNAIPGHNMPLGSLGVLLMAAAWVAYLMMRASDAKGAGLIGINAILAGSAGGLASLVYGQIRFGKPDAHLVYAGLLGALVAISGPADQVGTRWAVVIGAVAGLLVPYMLLILDMNWRLDDPSGSVAVHLVGGIWGTLAAGVFRHGFTVMDRLKSLGIQAIGLLAMMALTTALVGLALVIMKKTVGLRSKEADEFDGLDLAEHDIGAYPDFQQTMIKSYHLREA